MSDSDLVPRQPPNPEILDAEFEDVRDEDDRGASFKDLLAWLGTETAAAARTLLKLAGGVMLLIIIIGIINPGAGEDAASTQSEADRMTSEAGALAAQADAIAADVEADFAAETSFNADAADVNVYAIAEAGTACGSQPVQELMSAAMHDHMVKFLTVPKPDYLAGINRMIPPVRPAVASQFLASASMEWERQPAQTTWDIFDANMHIQCEGAVSVEIPRFKDDGSAAVFKFRPIEWAAILPTDLSGDLQVMIYDRPEDYGRKVFLDTAGQTMSLASLNSLLQ